MREHPFEVGLFLYLTVVGIAHVQWLFQLDLGLSRFREGVFLLSMLILIWAVSNLVSERRVVRFSCGGVILLILIFVSYVVNQYSFDLSSDTLTSHFELSFSTASGVNPYFDSSQAGTLDEYSVLGVAFHLIAGMSLNLGLSRNPFILGYLHMLLLTAAGVIAVAKSSYLRHRLWLVVGIALFCFPTLIQQILTGYRDGYAGLALLACLAVITDGWHRERMGTRALILGLAFSACLPSIKLSLLPVALLLSAICLFRTITLHGVRYWLGVRSLLLLPVIVLLWTFPVGFALLTTNETSRSLLSSEAIMATWSGSSQQLLEMNLVEEFMSLMFGLVQQNPSKIVWGIPFQLPSMDEVLVSGSPDPRLAGFGPWFGEAFFFAVLAATTATATSKKSSHNRLTSSNPAGHSLRHPEQGGYYWLLVIVMTIVFCLTPFRFNARYVMCLYVMLLILLWISLTSNQYTQSWTSPTSAFRLLSVLFLTANSLITWYGAANAATVNRQLALSLIDNYFDRVDDSPSSHKYAIVTGGKKGIVRYLPLQSPGGNDVTIKEFCDADTPDRVYWLGDDIGICEGVD